MLFTGGKDGWYKRQEGRAGVQGRSRTGAREKVGEEEGWCLVQDERRAGVPRRLFIPALQ